MYESYLQHHGRLGMKWGKRNGPPYPLNASQLSSAEKKAGSFLDRFKKKNASKDETTKQSTESKPKTIKDMTEDELNAKIKRLELEKKYRSLMNEIEPKQKNKGKQFVGDILEKSGKNILTQLTTYGMGKAVNGLFGQEIVNPKKGQKDK